MGKSIARSMAEEARPFSFPWNRPQSTRMPKSKTRSSWQEPVTPLTAPWCFISIIQQSLLMSQTERFQAVSLSGGPCHLYRDVRELPPRLYTKPDQPHHHSAHRLFGLLSKYSTQLYSQSSGWLGLIAPDIPQLHPMSMTLRAPSIFWDEPYPAGYRLSTIPRKAFRPAAIRYTQFQYRRLKNPEFSPQAPSSESSYGQGRLSLLALPYPAHTPLRPAPCCRLAGPTGWLPEWS